MTIKIGTIGHNDDIYLRFLDITTGERGAQFFNLQRICDLGYGDVCVGEIVVEVESRELGI